MLQRRREVGPVRLMSPTTNRCRHARILFQRLHVNPWVMSFSLRPMFPHSSRSAWLPVFTIICLFFSSPVVRLASYFRVDWSQTPW